VRCRHQCTLLVAIGWSIGEHHCSLHYRPVDWKGCRALHGVRPSVVLAGHHRRDHKGRRHCHSLYQSTHRLFTVRTDDAPSLSRSVAAGLYSCIIRRDRERPTAHFQRPKAVRPQTGPSAKEACDPTRRPAVHLAGSRLTVGSTSCIIVCTPDTNN